MNLKNILNKGKKVAATALICGTLLGTYNLEKATREYDAFNEVYRGHRNEKGIVMYAFDPQNIEDRINKNPEYFVFGNSDLKNQLKIGKEYNVETMSYGIPLKYFGVQEKIISINPHNPNNSINSK